MMVVVLNPFAGGGQAEKRWESIKNQIPGSYTVLNLAKIQNLHYHLSEAFLSGTRIFVAAGGDGTVNLLSQTLIETFSEHELKEISLGAVGIGSSNDYHKPINKAACINGHPCRLDLTHTQQRDLLKLTLCGDNNKTQQRFALLNASCGLTAKANFYFNKPNPILLFFKKISVNLAIFFAAIQSICALRNQPMTIATDHNHLQYQVTNIGIVKSPFFSGEFAYESQFIPDDGSYSVYVCHNMNVWEVVKTLFGLKKHKFIPSKKSLCIKLNETNSLKISSKTAFPFEFDGEVEWINFVKISMMKRFIRCCT